MSTDPAAPRPSRPHLPRDMDASPFSHILAALVQRVAGAYAAALVDTIGESVDYAGHVDPFDIKVAAATWRIVLKDINGLPHIGAARTLVVRGGRRSVIVRALPDDYAIVVLLGRRAGFTNTVRALSACEHALAREANWDLHAEALAWFAVTVTCDARHRPVSIVYGGLAEPVEVLGTVRAQDFALTPGERGFRVRLASGPEITLIREPGDFWYAEERVGP